MATEFKLPELGENIDSGTVAKILVSINDKISKDQPLLELETDKAVLEVPATMEGIIESIMVKEGDQVKTNQSVFIINENEMSFKEEVSQKPENIEITKNDKSSIGQTENNKTKEEISEIKEQDDQLIEIKLPELGENIASGTVAKISVNVGDQIKKKPNTIGIGNGQGGSRSAC
jgi:pyruvate dehydrogenase E2 component (dihydrolipoamide acetyltransferase)